MRVAHWSFLNGSGLCNLSFDMMEAERKLGIDSKVYPSVDVKRDESGKEVFSKSNEDLLSVEADIHVLHSSMPNEFVLKRKVPFVLIQHGTPEHMVQGALSYADSKTKMSFNMGDSLMQTTALSKYCRAMVTFHERHADIYGRMSDAPIYVVPSGVNREFWGEDDGKRLPIPGVPSMLYAENAHLIKWPFDIIAAWPRVVEEHPEAKFHLLKIPYDQHRVWFPLATSLGAIYTMYMSEQTMTQEGLRRLFRSIRYLISPVIKGDHNRLMMEAAASGCKVISYKGNHYADYWIDEGDHRIIANQIKDIFSGSVSPRPDKLEVPDSLKTAEAMIEIYKSISAAGS